jgi:hypothetical protein
MSINQNGFMKNRSTMTNLLEYASFVLNSIEDGNQVDSIYTDFSKAFDRVLHQLLLNDTADPNHINKLSTFSNISVCLNALKLV